MASTSSPDAGPSGPPAYSPTLLAPRIDRTEHAFHLPAKDKPWTTLKLVSNASSSSQPPIFVEGDDIAGVVELNVNKLESLQAVDISVSLGPSQTACYMLSAIL